MLKPVQNLEKWPKPWMVSLVFLILTAVGIVDYLTGFEIFFSVFYLFAVSLATWFVGRGFGLTVSFLSVMVWIAGDFAAGARYSTSFIPIWNAFVLLAFYFIVVWLLFSLRSLQKDLENRVRQRTVALTQEMAEREQLEKEILAVSEREQQRIGHDLHDSLGQHLTATALASRVLWEKLKKKSPEESPDANKITGLIEEGIALTRDLARGIYPVEMEAEGLMDALEELAINTAKWSQVSCQFECDPPVLVKDAAVSTHLYRIAQEAIANALRHGKPKNLIINLLEQNHSLVLTVEDDGVGIPEGWRERRGLGTRIMEHRARIMKGTFSIEPNPTGGTLAQCSIPMESKNPVNLV